MFMVVLTSDKVAVKKEHLHMSHKQTHRHTNTDAHTHVHVVTFSASFTAKFSVTLISIGIFCYTTNNINIYYIYCSID